MILCKFLVREAPRSIEQWLEALLCALVLRKDTDKGDRVCRRRGRIRRVSGQEEARHRQTNHYGVAKIELQNWDSFGEDTLKQQYRIHEIMQRNGTKRAKIFKLLRKARQVNIFCLGNGRAILTTELGYATIECIHHESAFSSPIIEQEHAFSTHLKN